MEILVIISEKVKRWLAIGLSIKSRFFLDFVSLSQIFCEWLWNSQLPSVVIKRYLGMKISKWNEKNILKRGKWVINEGLWKTESSNLSMGETYLIATLRI